LVATDIAQGETLVRALDTARFPVSAALWMYHPDQEAWRLVLATPRAIELRDAYTAIGKIMDDAGIEEPELARIRLVPPTEVTVATLSKANRIEGLKGVRLSQHMINGVYVDDAYVYRAAA
jgi:hypothetical protein